MAQTKVMLVFPGADAKRTIVWPCTVAVPQDGGTVLSFVVDVRFNLISRETYEKTFNDALAKNERGNLAVYDALVDGFPTFKNAAGDLVGDVDAKAFFRAEDFYVGGILQGFAQVRVGMPAKN